MQLSHKNQDTLDEALYEEFSVGKVKKYSCLFSQCNKTFGFKSQLKRHLVIHSKKRPYECSVPGCHKVFKRKDAVVNHMKTHSSRESFTCLISGCSSSFSTKSAYNFHVKKHHYKSSESTPQDVQNLFDDAINMKEIYQSTTVNPLKKNKTLTNDQYMEDCNRSGLHSSLYKDVLDGQDDLLSLETSTYSKEETNPSMKLHNEFMVDDFSNNLVNSEFKEVSFRDNTKSLIENSDTFLEKMLTALTKENNILKERIQMLSLKEKRNHLENHKQDDFDASKSSSTMMTLSSKSSEDIWDQIHLSLKERS